MQSWLRRKANDLRKRWRYLVFLIVLLGLVAGLFWPLPDYIESPGTAERISRFVTIDQQHDRHQGGYYLMTVALQQARPITWVIAHLRSDMTILKQADVLGGTTSQEYDRLEHYEMLSSENDAIQVAYHKAGKQVQRQYLGIYVLSILKRSKFKGQLALGDTVTAVNQQHFKTATGFMTYIQQQKVGQKVMITYLHHHQTKHATAALIRLPGTKKPGLGITLTDHNTIKTDPKIKVNVNRIGGPSGGLMFTTAIYDQLTGGHLRAGRKIAGTGTIDLNGKVGAIGGIDKKVIAADRAGATIFFAPNTPRTQNRKLPLDEQNNYQVAKRTAKRIHSHMKVIPVKTFDDVLTYLKK